MSRDAQQIRRSELATTTDPRAARTRDRIVDALRQVLESGEPLSVAAVCATAGVGRSTFYTHFATITDVVLHVVDEMYVELSARDADRRSRATMQKTAITRLGLHELMDALWERRCFLLYADSAPATERVRERLTAEMSAALRATITTERPDADADFIATSSDFIAGGAHGVLMGWLRDPRDRDSERLISTFMELFPVWLTGSAAQIDAEGDAPAH